MGRVKFNFYYPEFSNLFLSILTLAEIEPDFGINYKAYLQQQNRKFSAKDYEFLALFKSEILRLTENRKKLPQLWDIILDHRVENLIMFKRRINKEFGAFDCRKIDSVYLYFYKTISTDYKLFQFPIITALTRIEKHLEEQKVIYHLEKFHRFLEREKQIAIDSHFFVSCYYFGEGKKARFERISPNRILFYLPIIIKEGSLSFDFDEIAFLEQIFYQALTLQFETRREKFLPIFKEHNINEKNFGEAMVGAIHYGIYSFDVYKETLKLEKITDHLEEKLRDPEINKNQVSFAIRLTPLLDRFYKDRRGMDEEFLDEAVKIYKEWQEIKPQILKGEIVDTKGNNQGVIFQNN